MIIRNIVQSRLAEAVAEHSAMPFPDAIDDDDELEAALIGGVVGLGIGSLINNSQY